MAFLNWYSTYTAIPTVYSSHAEAAETISSLELFCVALLYILIDNDIEKRVPKNGPFVYRGYT